MVWVAFADPWVWGCSLVLTDPTVATSTDANLLEGAALNFQVLAHILKTLVSKLQLVGLNIRTQDSVGQLLWLVLRPLSRCEM